MRRGLQVTVLFVLVAAAPAALAATFTFRGSVAEADPDQKGRLVADDPPSGCAGSTAAVRRDSSPVNYDLYVFRNASASTECVTVELAVDPLLCPVSNPLQSAAYSPRFDASDVTANYLGDVGAEPELSKSYSFSVPGGADFDVTVNETNANAGCNSYSLTVAGTGISPKPTSVGLSFTAVRKPQGVVLHWGGERGDTVGFNLYRERLGRHTRLNRHLIPARTAVHAVHTWRDSAMSGVVRYWLEEVDQSGGKAWHGPARVPAGAAGTLSAGK